MPCPNAMLGTPQPIRRRLQWHRLRRQAVRENDACANVALPAP